MNTFRSAIILQEKESKKQFSKTTSKAGFIIIQGSDRFCAIIASGSRTRQKQ
jgi:hypothetical protein